MDLKTSSRFLALLVAGALAVTACGSDDDEPSTGTSPAAGTGTTDTTSAQPAVDDTLSGRLVGAGSSAQTAAMTAWQAGFVKANPDVTFAYDPTGSGAGRKAFLAGGTLFAGSDAYLDEAELAMAKTRCNGGTVVEIPAYISPIAVAYNLEGIEALNLSPEVMAGIFAQEITDWDDPKIAADNPDTDLPDLAITPVHRGDDSGTTENFTSYLAATAPKIWTYEVSGNWPITGGEVANGTAGVVAAIEAGNGAIGYAGASQVGDLGVARVLVGDEFIDYSPEGAAALVDLSPQAQGRPVTSLAVNLDRTITDPSAYPLALVSYLIGCTLYDEANNAALVEAFFSYVISPEAQQAAALNAGSAPISDTLRTKAQAAIDVIAAA